MVSLRSGESVPGSSQQFRVRRHFLSQGSTSSDDSASEIDSEQANNEERDNVVDLVSSDSDSGDTDSASSDADFSDSDLDNREAKPGPSKRVITRSETASPMKRTRERRERQALPTPKRRQLISVSTSNTPARQTRSSQQQRMKAASRRISQQNSKAKSKAASRQSFVIGRAREPMLVEIPTFHVTLDDSKPMPWGTLPYLIWAQIFTVAADMVKETTDGATATRWLRRCCTISRDLTEPAITALYASPTLASDHQLQLFLRTLRENSTIYNYGRKVRSLHLNPSLFSPESTEYTLFEHTPQLVDLQFALFKDNDRHDQGQRILQKKSYILEIFESLDRGGVVLNTWRWNLRILGSKDWSFHQDIHARVAFKQLKGLSLVNYSSSRRDQGRDVLLMADAINALHQLQSLRFENCLIVHKDFLELLKAPMLSLSFVNCDNLYSDVLDEYLMNRGGRLETLVLNENRSLNLDFLPNLAQSCPALKRLHADLHYTSTLQTVTNTAPLFNELIQRGSQPSWPLTLQEITFFYLRQWDSDVAETFFETLVHAAPSLTDLRRLVMTATIDMSWRDRASFRDRWVDKIQRTFKRPFEAPDPDLISVEIFYERKDQERQRMKKVFDGLQDSPARRSSRQKEIQRDSIRKDGSFRVRRRDRAEKFRESLRKEFQSASGNPEDWDSEESSDNSSINDVEEDAVPRQRMCDVVEFRIDNLRPAENQFREEDFLDQEISGDEDWTGNDMEFN